MTDRGVLVYGSLLYEPALAATFSEETVERAVPVRVDGFRRSFGMASKYREGENGERAILTAERDPDAWLNAVLVPAVPDEEFEWYRQREYRYDLVNVDSSAIQPYGEGETPRGDDDDVIARLDERLVATADADLAAPEPIPYYAAECVEGARGWGERFLADFLVTTHRL